MDMENLKIQSLTIEQERDRVSWGDTRIRSYGNKRNSICLIAGIEVIWFEQLSFFVTCWLCALSECCGCVCVCVCECVCVCVCVYVCVCVCVSVNAHVCMHMFPFSVHLWGEMNMNIPIGWYWWQPAWLNQHGTVLKASVNQSLCAWENEMIFTALFIKRNSSGRSQARLITHSYQPVIYLCVNARKEAQWQMNDCGTWPH